MGDLVTAALIAGGLSLAGTGVSAGVNAFNTASANRAAAGRAFEANATGVEMMRQGFNFDRDEAAKGREWDEMMAKISRVYNRDEASMARDWNERMSQVQWDRSLDLLGRDQSFSRAMQDRQFEFNAVEAMKQREWQENLSGTAYQRAVGDMRRAGLNPIAMFPGGASTPSGAAASGGLVSAASHQPGLPSNAVASTGLSHGATAKGVGFRPGAQAQTFQADMGNIVNTGMRAAMLATDLQRGQAEVQNIKAQNLNIQSQTRLNELQGYEVVERSNLHVADQRLRAKQELSEAALPALRGAQTSAAVAGAGLSDASAGTAKSQTRLNEIESRLKELAGKGLAANELEGLSRVFDEILRLGREHFRK